MHILLWLGLLQPAPALNCQQHRALCALLGPQAQDFAQALWRLRLLSAADLNHRAARLRAVHTTPPATGSGPLSLERLDWRLYGAQESVVIGRSFEQREGIWWPASARVCLDVQTHSTLAAVCAYEDYVALSSPQALGPACLRRGAQELCLD